MASSTTRTHRSEPSATEAFKAFGGSAYAPGLLDAAPPAPPRRIAEPSSVEDGARTT